LYSLEKDVLESTVYLIRNNHPNGIVPISKIWDRVILHTNGQVNQFKENEVITEIYGTFSKASILKMIRDRFGPEEKRYESFRCLAFNVENLDRYYQDYLRGEKPTQINCQLVMDDSNDANDANIESVIDMICNYNNGQDILPSPEIDKDVQKIFDAEVTPELSNDMKLYQIDNKRPGISK
jgi:hypothetical protein